jgi:pimeloyl-ACP methyl ester carboxylesterase
MEERIHLIPPQDVTLFEDRHRLLAPGRLERVAIPVLLLEGADSPPIIHEVNDALARRLADARVVSIPGASHMGPVTHAAEVAAAMTELLELT